MATFFSTLEIKTSSMEINPKLAESKRWTITSAYRRIGLVKCVYKGEAKP